MAGLEDQVIQLRDSYEEKERKLIAERDEALQQARWVGLKMHTARCCDNSDQNKSLITNMIKT